MLPSVILYCTVLYCIVQHNTVWYSIVQYNTVQLSCPLVPCSHALSWVYCGSDSYMHRNAVWYSAVKYHAMWGEIFEFTKESNLHYGEIVLCQPEWKLYYCNSTVLLSCPLVPNYVPCTLSSSAIVPSYHALSCPALMLSRGLNYCGSDSYMHRNAA